MTKAIGPSLIAAQGGEVTTLATCWLVERQDGRRFGFTDHDKDLTIDGLLYKASSGFDPTNVETSREMNVDTTQADGVIGVGTQDISHADVVAGLWDGARMTIFQVDYTDLTKGAMPKRSGWLGEVGVSNKAFTADLRGLMQALQQEIGRLQTQACSWDFCSTECGLPIIYFTFTATVQSVVSSRVFTASTLSQDASYFTGGKVTFRSGLNNGISMEVKSHAPISGGEAEIGLQMGMPFEVAVGDTFEITGGCDKSWETCQNRFSNLVNFGGFPDIPGMDKLAVNAKPAEQN